MPHGLGGCGGLGDRFRSGRVRFRVRFRVRVPGPRLGLCPRPKQGSGLVTCHIADATALRARIAPKPQTLAAPGMTARIRGAAALRTSAWPPCSYRQRDVRLSGKGRFRRGYPLLSGRKAATRPPMAAPSPPQWPLSGHSTGDRMLLGPGRTGARHAACAWDAPSIPGAASGVARARMSAAAHPEDGTPAPPPHERWSQDRVTCSALLARREFLRTGPASGGMAAPEFRRVPV